MSYAPFGAPDDYVAAFGVAGVLTYPEPRVFLEAQSHLQPEGETSRHHFEHVHIGACYPYAGTWLQPSNARTIDVRYVFHRVSNYNIAQAAASFIDANNSGGGYTATAAQKAELEAAMDASADSTQVVFQRYTMLNIGTSCRKTFRPTLNTVRANAAALVDEWFTAAQWTSYISYPGQPICTPEFQVDQIRARSWILGGTSVGYLYATVLGFPPAALMGDALFGSLDFVLAGTGGQPYSVYVDPDFHAHDPSSPSGDNLGIWHQDLGPVTGQLAVSVPLDGIPAGDHRLVVITSRGSQSAIQVIPFRVGDLEAPSVPTGLTKSDPQPSSVLLSWDAPAASEGVVGYRVYRDGVQVADVSGTSRRVDGLAAAGHLLEVEAYDAAGNVSARASSTVTRSWV